MSAHTNGPWKVDTWNYPAHGNTPARKVLSIVNDKMRVAVAESDEGNENPYTFPFAEAEANAKLIAAAPDLLAACMALMAYYDDDTQSLEDVETMDRVAEKARAAIAKATVN